MSLLDRCIFTAAGGGSGAFTQSGALAGFQTMQTAGAVAGQNYSYVAQSADLSQWEVGVGTYAGISTPTQILTWVSQADANSGVAFGQSSSVDSPAGAMVFLSVKCTHNIQTISTLVDSAGNTYTVIQPPNASPCNNIAIAYCLNALHLPVGSTWTATTSGAGQWNIRGVFYVLGANGGLDQSTTKNITTNGTALSMTTAQLASSHSLVIANLIPFNETDQTAGGPVSPEPSGFTNLFANASNQFDYQIVTGSQAAVTYSAAWPTTKPAAAVMAVFSPTLNPPTTVLARTTIQFNSAGNTSPINFSLAPTVMMTALASDVRTKLTGNTTFYVATTGSDATGTGSVNNPWLTLQNAINVLATTIDGSGYAATILLGAGSFAGVGFKAMTGMAYLQIDGAGSASTTISNGPNDGSFNNGEPISCLFAIGTTIFLNKATLLNSLDNTPVLRLDATGQTIIFGDRVNYAGMDMVISHNTVTNTHFATIEVDGPNSVESTNGTITFNHPTVTTDSEISLADGARCQFPATIVVTSTPTITTAFLVGRGSVNFSFFGSSISGAASGAKYKLTNGTNVQTGGQTIPGNSFGSVDGSSSIDGDNSGVSKSGLPAPGDITASTFAVFKDTSGGGVYVAYNDAGTIKKVALT